MPYYENVFIGRQDLSSAQVEALTDSYAAIIEEQGGKVLKREHWGLKSLAYRIKKNRKGHYVMLDVEAEWPALAEVERQMRLSEDIIRFLTVRVEEVTEEPSPMMTRRDRDERRPRRDDRGGDRGGDSGGDRGGRDDRPPRREENSEAAPAAAGGTE